MKLTNKVTNPRGIKYELDKEVFTGDYWVDEKPIYAYTKKVSLNGNTEIPLMFTYVDLLSYEVYFKGLDEGMGNLPFFGIPYFIKESDNARAFITGNKMYIKLGQEFIKFKEALVYLKYTKSGGGN